MGKKILAVWVCLVCVIITACFLFIYQEKLQMILDRTAHIQATLSSIYDLQNNISEAEAATRGFVITGEEVQLVYYREAIREIDRVYVQLRQMAAEEPDQQRLLDTLAPLIKQRLIYFEKTIALRRQKGYESLEIVAIAREGMKAQDRIRKLLQVIENTEKKQLVPQWFEEKKRTRIWIGALAIGTLLSLSSLFLMLYFLGEAIKERKRAEEQLLRHQENLRSLASQLTLAEERERRRIAANLHDQIGQTLALSNIKIQELRKSLPDGGDHLGAELDQISGLLEQTIHDAKSLILKISSPILYELGLEAAVESLVEELPKQHGLTAHFTTDTQPKPLDDDLQILLFQAVSELVLNVVKHARAHNLEVAMQRQGNQMRLTVTDDGVGFNGARIGLPGKTSRGFGLFSIQERLRPFGGQLEVRPKAGIGTAVTLSVPLKPAA
jgi:signal transduction histidine kinase